MDLDFNLESLARHLDLSDLQYLLAQDSLGVEDDDLDLENPFPTVTQFEVEETPEQSKKGLRSRGLWS